MDCFEYERIWKERSISWLKNHPGVYLSKIPGRLYYMYQSDYDNMPAFLSDKSKAENNYITIPYKHLISEYNTINFAQWLSLASLFFYYILLIIATIGAFKLYHYQQYRTLFLTLSIIVGGTLALVIVMHGETRFKDSLMPFLFMLASIHWNKQGLNLCNREEAISNRKMIKYPTLPIHKEFESIDSIFIASVLK